MAVKPDRQTGFSTGVKYWLFFMLCFVFLGYSPALSITLGAIGGLAGGTIAAWLNPKEDYIDKQEKLAKQEENLPEPEPKKIRFRRYGSAPYLPQRTTRATRRFGWLLRRKT